jgi:hypothetical protein
VTVAGDVRWTDAELDLEPGDRLQYSAEGIVAHGGGGPDSVVGPAGDLWPDTAAANLVVDGEPLEGNHAALVRPIGEGRPFVMGASGEVAVEAPGPLQLGVNDDDVENNRGEFTVERG